MEDLSRFIEMIPEELRSKPIWTVSVENSEGKMKCVGSIHNFKDGKPRRGHCDDTDYETLERVVEICDANGYEITNLRMRSPARSGYMVLDIEKTASQETRDRFADTDYVYAETSLSGKGLHMLVRECDGPFEPLITSLKDDSGEFEILLNQDVTFTGNDMRGPRFGTDEEIAERWEQICEEGHRLLDDIDKETADLVYDVDFPCEHMIHLSTPFYIVYDELLDIYIKKHRKERVKISGWDDDEPESEVYKNIKDEVFEEFFIGKLEKAAKTIWGKHNDLSKALWSIGHLFYRKELLPKIRAYQSLGEEVLFDEAAWLLYLVLEDTVAPLRYDGKYDGERHGVPILLDEARRIIEDCIDNDDEEEDEDDE